MLFKSAVLVLKNHYLTLENTNFGHWVWSFFCCCFSNVSFCFWLCIISQIISHYWVILIPAIFTTVLWRKTKTFETTIAIYPFLFSRRQRSFKLILWSQRSIFFYYFRTFPQISFKLFFIEICINLQLFGGLLLNCGYGNISINICWH